MHEVGEEIFRLKNDNREARNCFILLKREPFEDQFWRSATHLKYLKL